MKPTRTNIGTLSKLAVPVALTLAGGLAVPPTASAGDGADHGCSAKTLRGEYQRWDSRGDNLGVGEFELPERAYSDDTTGDIARLSAIGTIGRHFLNEIRLEYVDIRNSVDSLSETIRNRFATASSSASSGARSA